MRLAIFCLVICCGSRLGYAGTDLPKLGKASEAWFAPNPYAADSSVHAYVIAQDIGINFGWLYLGSNKLSRRIETRRIVRVLDPQGYEQALIKIYFYDPENGGAGERLTNLEAYTHEMLNGQVKTNKVAKQERYRTRLSPEVVEVAFSFPGVVAGTVLDLSYTRDSESLRYCPTTYFQDYIPVQIAETRLKSHEAFRYQTHVLGHERVTQTVDHDPYPDRGVEGRQVTHTFRAENLPALTPEPYITALGNYRSHLRIELQTFAYPGNQTVEFSGSWATISEALTEAPGVKAALRGKGDYQAWAAACPTALTEPQDKAAWAIAKVASLVRWSGYHSPYASSKLSALVDAGEGSSAEVNALLLGVLRALGLDASPVFMSTRDHGRLLQHLPTLSSVNSMIVAFDAGGKILLVDGVDPTGYPGVLPLDDHNGEGLMVSDKGLLSFVSLQDASIDQRALQALLEVDAEGYVFGYAALTLSGLAAKPFITATADGLRLAVDTGALFEGFHVTNLVITREKAYAWRLTADVRSLLPAPDLGGALALNPNLAPQWSKNPFSYAERRYPVEFPAKIVETRQISVKLPSDMRLEAIPPTVYMTTVNRDAFYRHQVTDEDNTLSISSTLAVKNLTYLPDRYGEVRGLFGKVVEQEAALLSIVAAH